MIFIGIILFLFILFQINLIVLFESLLKVNLILLLFVFVLSVFSLFVRSLKWKLISSELGVILSYEEIFKYYFIGIFLGLITPGRIGDFSKAIYVKNKFNSLSNALSSVFVDRLFDIGVLFIIGFISVFLFSLLLGVEIFSWTILLLLIIAFMLFVLFIFKIKNFEFILKPMFNFFIPDKYKLRLKGGYHIFNDSLKKIIKLRILLLALFFSLFSWIITILSGFFLGIALGFDISVVAYFVIIPIIVLLELLPISISGVGSRDVALIFLLSFYSISPELAVAFSILYLIVINLFVSIIGFLLFLRNPLEF